MDRCWNAYAENFVECTEASRLNGEFQIECNRHIISCEEGKQIITSRLFHILQLVHVQVVLAMMAATTVSMPSAAVNTWNIMRTLRSVLLKLEILLHCMTSCGNLDGSGVNQCEKN